MLQKYIFSGFATVVSNALPFSLPNRTAFPRLRPTSQRLCEGGGFTKA